MRTMDIICGSKYMVTTLIMYEDNVEVASKQYDSTTGAGADGARWLAHGALPRSCNPRVIKEEIMKELDFSKKLRTVDHKFGVRIVESLGAGHRVVLWNNSKGLPISSVIDVYGRPVVRTDMAGYKPIIENVPMCWRLQAEHSSGAISIAAYPSLAECCAAMEKFPCPENYKFTIVLIK